MTPDQHARVKELFFKARELDAESRIQFLLSKCRDDSAILDEVNSLLAHDDTKTILTGATETVAETPRSIRRPRRRVLSRIERAASEILRQIFGRWDRRLFLILVTISLMIGLAIWMYLGMKKATESLAGSELQTILNADVTALQLWIEEKKKDVRLWSSRDDLREAVAELVRIAETERQPGEKLLAAPAQSELRRLLEKYDRIVGRPEKDGVITRCGLLVASELDEVVGVQLNDRGVAALAPVFQGETLFLKPHPEGMYGAGTDPDLDVPVVFFVAPVMSGDAEESEVIAAAGFGFPADDEFTKILAVARVGQTGETYAFDANGELLSESRFDDELRALGLLPEDPNSRSIFRMDVRDPGPPIDRQPPTPVEMAAWPLTRLAADAIAAGRKGGESDREGLILKPYRNYRGAIVIGAWKWLPEYSFGVANEVEIAEQYSPMRYPMVAEWIRFGLLIVCIASLLIAACWIAVLGRDVEEAWQLDQYTLEQKIGEGGMGVVYRARHALLKRPAAVKLLRPEVINDESLARFKREVQLASRLTHPNTIDIFDFGQAADGNFYCVMEFLDGLTLDSLVQAKGPLSVDRTVKILVQIAGSLQEAHRRGLVHRDIKPSNIMLCDQGGIPDFVKVLDFGLARNVERSDDSQITKAGLVAGTPAYLAPERITDPTIVDQRSDLYSFGAVGYYLLTGRSVYDTRDPDELIRQILEQKPHRPSEVTGREIPPELEDLIMRCLTRRLESRPASIEDVLKSLEDISGQRLEREKAS